MKQFIVELDTDDPKVAEEALRYIWESVDGRNGAIGELPCNVLIDNRWAVEKFD